MYICRDSERQLHEISFGSITMDVRSLEKNLQVKRLHGHFYPAFLYTCATQNFMSNSSFSNSCPDETIKHKV